jgi:hypothetical protein
MTLEKYRNVGVMANFISFFTAKRVKSSKQLLEPFCVFISGTFENTFRRKSSKSKKVAKIVTFYFRWGLQIFQLAFRSQNFICNSAAASGILSGPGNSVNVDCGVVGST